MVTFTLTVTGTTGGNYEHLDTNDTAVVTVTKVRPLESGTVSLTPSGGGFTPIRMNAGATAPYTDTLGQVWAADSGFTAGCGRVTRRTCTCCWAAWTASWRRPPMTSVTRPRQKS